MNEQHYELHTIDEISQKLIDKNRLSPVVIRFWCERVEVVQKIAHSSFLPLEGHKIFDGGVFYEVVGVTHTVADPYPESPRFLMSTPTVDCVPVDWDREDEVDD